MNVETIMWENHKGKVVPYFKGSSVATILWYEDRDQAVRNHCKNIVKASLLDVRKALYMAENSEAVQNTGVTPYKALTDSGYSHSEVVAKQSWISEMDVYRLVIRSTKPEAEQFQDWVNIAGLKLAITFTQSVEVGNLKLRFQASDITQIEDMN